MASRRLVAAVLAVLGSLAVMATRPGPEDVDRPPPARDAPVARTQAPAPAPEPDATPRLEGIRDDELDAQIRRVIESMDATGRPPRGVLQGGRRGGARGVFENAERRLPPRPRGYYVETDVWPPRRSGRGAQRLVFGREREVYYTADHYRSFVRVR
jgi:guanyl-specific ribonuclease Sa